MRGQTMAEIPTSPVAVEQDNDASEVLDRWRKRAEVIEQAVEAGDVGALRILDVLTKEVGMLDRDLDQAAEWGLTLAEFAAGANDSNDEIASLMRLAVEHRAQLGHWTLSRIERAKDGDVFVAYRAEYGRERAPAWIEYDEDSGDLSWSDGAPPFGVLLRDLRAALAEVAS
jgi:hypothetical protein